MQLTLFTVYIYRLLKLGCRRDGSYRPAQRWTSTPCLLGHTRKSLPARGWRVCDLPGNKNWSNCSRQRLPHKSEIKEVLLLLLTPEILVFQSGREAYTPSPKQPFSFLGRLAINSYLALCQQESDSVACGSAWLTVHSGGWGYRVICVFPSSLQLKK